MRRIHHLSGLLLVSAVLVSLQNAAPVVLLAADTPRFPGEVTDWNGFQRYDFEVGGNPAVVVAPKQPAEGHPWVWHGEFFGHKPEPDIALLKRGFHVAYLRVPNLLGSPRAVNHWNEFYRTLTEQYGFSPKPALVGLSRGGLYCYNWAAANPNRVACIYGDAPVCDFKSWPGGQGTGGGSPSEWQRVLQVYGFASDEEANAYTGNPIDRLEPLARAGVPLLHVYGTADSVVPWKENTGAVAKRYRKLGGTILLIEKPHIGHHPHGLIDSAPIVEFISKFAGHESDSASENGSRQPTYRDPVDRMAAALQPSRQVIYKTIGERELKLHVFEPDGFQRSDRRPAFVTIHGGGWTGGEPRRMYPFACHFGQRGMVGISVEYRLLDTKRATTVFDCVEDGRSAIRFIRAYAGELGVSSERIVVSGGSAGGHVAAGTALFDQVNAATDNAEISPVPDALVLLFPVIDTSKDGYGNTKIGPRWKELSPLHQVKGKLPPTLVFHGTADTVTPFSGADAFCQAMNEAGNECVLQAFRGGQHGYLMRDETLYRESLKDTEWFLRDQGFAE